MLLALPRRTVMGFHIDPETGQRGPLQYASNPERVWCELSELVNTGLFEEADGRVEEYFHASIDSRQLDYKLMAQLEARCTRIETPERMNPKFECPGPLGAKRYNRASEYLKIWADHLTFGDNTEGHIMIDVINGRRIKELQDQGDKTLKEQMRVYVDCTKLRVAALQGDTSAIGCFESEGAEAVAAKLIGQGDCTTAIKGLRAVIEIVGDVSTEEFQAGHLFTLLAEALAQHGTQRSRKDAARIYKELLAGWHRHKTAGPLDEKKLQELREALAGCLKK